MAFGISLELVIGLVGAVIGGSFTLVAQYYGNWSQRRTDRRRIRQAFISEILSMRVEVLVQELFEDVIEMDEIPDGMERQAHQLISEQIEYALDDELNKFWEEMITEVRESPDFNISGAQGLFLVREGIDTLFPTRIFESNSDKLGRLDPEEIDHLINLYSAVEVFKQFIESDFAEEILFVDAGLLEPEEGLIEVDEKTRDQFRGSLLIILVFLYMLKKESLKRLRERQSVS